MSDNNTFHDPFENYLAHEGVLRKSGRYPWGSGNDPYQRNRDFLGWVDKLSKQGLSDAEIAKGLGLKTENGREFTSTDIRALKSIAKTANREADISRAIMLQKTGMSNIAIGKEMGKNESTIRSLLDPSLRERNDILQNTADILRERIGKDGIIDVGTGVENHLSIAASKKNVAIAMLEEEGYKKFYVPIEQQGTGKITNTMVLAPPGTTFPEVMARKSEIKPVMAYSEDKGRSYKKVEAPSSVDLKRVNVRWKEEGGAEKDGVIELRRDVADLSLGESRYAQVRVKVGDGHYLKGMAMYSDDMPPGVDIVFNTNKGKSPNKLDAMKEIKVDNRTKKQDEDLPFGSIVRQKHYTDPKTGKLKLSPLNIVGTQKTDDDGNDISYSGEEGGWSRWSKTLSSQMLSKQTPALAKQQLGVSYDAKKSEFDEIMSLSNPVVRKKLLEEYADGADSSAKHLKAAGLPRTSNHVILPINSLKDTEIYAPKFNNGERVVLVRHPHGGIFEIPELTVNNRNKEANRLIKNAQDAVGINSKVAGRLSGADFDGDTVLVIPQGAGRKVKTKPALTQLKNFDPQADFRPYDGMKTIDGGTYSAATKKVEYGPKGPNPGNKQRQMGDVSNLITDMTIKGASDAEIARAVKHSMVVIDAEKHKLNYKQSAQDHGIPELKKKYQSEDGTNPRAGASTLISRAKSPEYINERKARSAAAGGAIDPATGKKVFVDTGATYKVTKTTKRNGVVETIVPRTMAVPKMDFVDDARKLSSGTVMEGVYADHANKLKGLANNARKEAVAIKTQPQNKSAKKVYAAEVDSIKAKLDIAKRNAPVERQAQLLAATNIAAKRQSNPHMEAAEVKKVRSQALTEARIRLQAGKKRITFTPQEWEAVQAGAISTNILRSVLDNADMDQVRQLATPRDRPVMTDAKIRQAKSMLSLGYTQAEIASRLGVPASTLQDAVQ